MPNLNTGILESLPIIAPGEEVLTAFEEIAGAIEARITLNHIHANSLAQTRDTILPRLISGQLRIPEFQQEIEEVLA